MPPLTNRGPQSSRLSLWPICTFQCQFSQKLVGLTVVATAGVPSQGLRIRGAPTTCPEKSMLVIPGTSLPSHYQPLPPDHLPCNSPAGSTWCSSRSWSPGQTCCCSEVSWPQRCSCSSSSWLLLLLCWSAGDSQRWSQSWLSSHQSQSQLTVRVAEWQWLRLNIILCRLQARS